MKRKILYVGLDVHKNSTDVAIATDRSNGKVRSYGKIASTPDALNKLVKKLQVDDKQLRFVYEAGPCGYQIYRHLDTKGIHCCVVAPSMIVRRSGDRIKTDRRDVINLVVRLFRAGELTSIYVPTPEDEAIRDLLLAEVFQDHTLRLARCVFDGFEGKTTAHEVRPAAALHAVQRIIKAKGK